jgi:hypothetical protein
MASQWAVEDILLHPNQSIIFLNMKKNKLKKAYMFLLMGGLCASCASKYEAIGHVSLLSDHTIKPGIAYEQLTTNSGGSKKELKHSKLGSIDDAVTQVISKVPGGCFITDVTIYVVNDGYYAVSGNVWGAAASDTLTHSASNSFVSATSASYSRTLKSK